MNYREALTWLFGTQRFGIKLGLESSRRLFASLGIPAPNERIIHVAGTNGKGSVCAMLDSILRAAGYRSGLFTSPHLVTFRERIRVDGEMISEAEVARGLTSIRNAVREWDPHPTFFEIATALGLIHFRDTQPDFVILETGMGGRLDATNATQATVSVITPIDYDHQKWLGNTLSEIAFEKAGIIKPKTPVVSARQPEEAARVLRARAEECGAPLEFVRQEFQKFPIALGGSHQKENAALALAALRAAKVAIKDEDARRGLSAVQWPARFQRWDERTIIDGAHNPAGACSLTNAWRETYGEQRATIILATLADKDVASLCAALAPIAQQFFLPKIRSERALDPEKLGLTINESAPELRMKTFDSFASAWMEAQNDSAPVLITGSLHFAGEALAFLRGEPAAYDECLQ